jgi:hypothetical protein
LFEISTPTAVLPKMNDLYVFWAEVNEGLVGLRKVLNLEASAQPGRVLIHALDACKK